MKTLSCSSKEWAEKELNIESGSNTQQALLKYIDSTGFILNDCEVDALDILAGNQDAEYSEYFQNHFSENLLIEIKEFKKEFFTIPVHERTVRLKELQKKGQNFIECMAVLSELQRGVTIDKNSLPDNNRLVDTLLRIFVSDHSERAKIFDAIISLNKKEKKILCKEYDKLLPDLKSLCPQFSMYLKEETAAPKKKKLKQPVESNTIWLIIILAYVAIKFLLSLSVSTPSADDIKEIQQKTKKYNLDLNKDKKFSKQEIDEFLKYLENQKPKLPNTEEGKPDVQSFK